MLPKENRLKKENDFKKIMRSGRIIKGDFLIMKFTENSANSVKVGISVPKKVLKKATARNKQKRRIAAAIEAELPQIKKGLDLFLIARPGLEDKKFSDIKKMCLYLFNKAKILKQ